MRRGLGAALIGLAGVAGVAGTACGGASSDVGPTITTPPVVVSPDTVPLRTLAQSRGLRLGTAMDRGLRLAGTEGVAFRALAAREFSVVTPENDMKHERLHPTATTYRFESADSLVTFAVQNNMQVRGHTLVWHRQLASWLANGTFSADAAKQQLTDYVTTVATHYKGKLLAWDVVNEALNDDGSMRSSFWFDRIGKAYVELAFRTARAADPDVPLFYNDYNIEGVNAKSDSAFAMVKDFQARGVPITGVGLQAHFVMNGVPSSLGANIARFAALGLKVHITELDVRLSLPTTLSSWNAQAQNYRDVVNVCLQYKACEVVTIWGFTDKDSWVPSSFPGFGEALPWDAGMHTKPAYTSLYNVLAGR